MNVGYKSYNCEDAARIFKVSTATVTAWCRQGHMNYTDVSGHKSKRPRYEFSRTEIDRVKALIKKYGRRYWTMYNNKDEEINVYSEVDLTPHEDVTQLSDKEVEEGLLKFNKEKRTQFNVSISVDDKKVVDDECEKLGISRAEYITQLIRGITPVPVATPVPVVEAKHTSNFDVDKFLNQVVRIQDIKKRLDELEAERTQLVNELAMIKQEMIEVI